MLRTKQYEDVIRIDSARTIAGRSYYWATAYLVGGILVDTGCAHTADTLASWARDQEITCVVNTHSHEDHIGANGILQHDHQGMQIYAPPLALPVLENPREEQPLQMYRRGFWGWPEPSKGQAVQDGEVIKTGQVGPLFLSLYYSAKRGLVLAIVMAIVSLV